MKNNRIYFFIFVLISCMVSCDKESGEPDPSGMNSHRVKRMLVHVQGKDDEQILFNYNTAGKLTRAYRCGTHETPGKPLEDGTPTIKRDTLGYMGKSVGETGEKFFVNSYLVNIDQDSIDRLMIEFPEAYKDSIMRRRIARSSDSLLFDKQNTNLIKEETQKSYRVRDDFGLGQNFNNKMLNDSKNVYKYEYNSNFQPVIVRHINYTYKTDVKLNEEFDKLTYKIEFFYSDNQIQSAVVYQLVIGMEENWSKVDTYTYSYSAGELMNIEGTNYRFARSGQVITIVKNGVTETYTLNNNGYVGKIDYGNGTSIEVEYEAGNGDFGNLYMTTYSKMLGVPMIR